MLRNWLVSAWLSSPLAGEPPAIDAVLAWEMSLRLGYKHAKKMGRWIPESEIQDVPIPLARRTIGGYDILCASDPIIPPLVIPEWTDHTARRFESEKMALMISPDLRKSVLTASGPYKSRFAAERIRTVPRVCWFVRGDKKEMNHLLKYVFAIGRHRAIGYGQVYKWSYDEVEDDHSISTLQRGKPVLMRAVPMPSAMDLNACGYRQSYGGWRPPYWHPALHREIAVPC